MGCVGHPGPASVGACPYLSICIGCSETHRVSPHPVSPLSPTQSCGEDGPAGVTSLWKEETGFPGPLCLAQAHQGPWGGSCGPAWSSGSSRDSCPWSKPAHKGSAFWVFKKSCRFLSSSCVTSDSASAESYPVPTSTLFAAPHWFYEKLLVLSDFQGRLHHEDGDQTPLCDAFPAAAKGPRWGHAPLSPGHAGSFKRFSQVPHVLFRVRKESVRSQQLPSQPRS